MFNRNLFNTSTFNSVLVFLTVPIIGLVEQNGGNFKKRRRKEVFISVKLNIRVVGIKLFEVLKSYPIIAIIINKVFFNSIIFGKKEVFENLYVKNIQGIKIFDLLENSFVSGKIVTSTKNKLLLSGIKSSDIKENISFEGKELSEKIVFSSVLSGIKLHEIIDSKKEIYGIKEVKINNNLIINGQKDFKELLLLLLEHC